MFQKSWLLDLRLARPLLISLVLFLGYLALQMSLCLHIVITTETVPVNNVFCCYCYACSHAGLTPDTEYVIKIVALNNAQRSTPLVGKAKTRKRIFMNIPLHIECTYSALFWPKGALLICVSLTHLFVRTAKSTAAPPVARTQPTSSWNPGCPRRQWQLQQPRTCVGAKHRQHTWAAGPTYLHRISEFEPGQQRPAGSKPAQAPGLHPPAGSRWPESSIGEGERGSWTRIPLLRPLQWDKPATGISDPDHNHLAACAAHFGVCCVLQSHHRDQWEEFPGVWRSLGSSDTVVEVTCLWFNV